MIWNTYLLYNFRKKPLSISYPTTQAAEFILWNYTIQWVVKRLSKVRILFIITVRRLLGKRRWIVFFCSSWSQIVKSPMLYFSINHDLLTVWFNRVGAPFSDAHSSFRCLIVRHSLSLTSAVKTNLIYYISHIIAYTPWTRKTGFLVIFYRIFTLIRTKLHENRQQYTGCVARSEYVIKCS